MASMTFLQLLIWIVLSAVMLVLSIAFGIRHWSETRGKIIAVGSGLALVGLIVGVAFLILVAAILPAVIALP